MMKHKDKNKCEKCNKMFPDKKGLEAHMKASHASKLYACEKCNKMFPDKKGLEAHMKASHASKLYACTECDGKFTAEHALKQHKKAVHNNPTPVRPQGRENEQNKTQNTFKCRMCGEGCESGSALDSHIAQCPRNMGSPMGRPMCTFYMQDMCTRGNMCRFSHVNNSHSEEPETCRRGPRCPFLLAGNCFYFHSVQEMGPMQQQEQTRQQQEQQPRQQLRGRGQPSSWAQNSNNWGNKACTRGPGCHYLAAGTCFFFHPGSGVQNQGFKEGQGPSQRVHHGSQGGRQGVQGGRQGVQGGRQGAQGAGQWTQKQKACIYNEDCRRVPYCPFKHYNEDFPQGLETQAKL